jgi:hypothetical protein
MNRFFIGFLFLFISASLFSQTPFPEVLFNGKAPVNGKIESCFLPAQIDFNFALSDTVYTIKKGMAIYNRLSADDTIFFKSNSARNEVALPGESIEILIQEVEVKVKDVFIRKDTNLLYKSFECVYVPITLDECKFINNNNCTLSCNKKVVNTDKTLALKDKNVWTISDSDILKIKRMDLIMVRGKRPVAACNSISNKVEETSFKKGVKPGDIVLIFGYGTGPQKKISKVVFVK